MQKQRYQQIFTYENRHWWYSGRRFLLVKILTAQKIKNAKILDFGCGPGSTISVLNKFGTVFGIDISPQAVSYCHKKGFKNVTLIKPGKELSYKENAFDVITCMDVLEHIQDDVKTLIDLRIKLSRNGLLIISVPAFMFLWSELDSHSMHVRRYSKEELIEKLSRAGFHITSIHYFNIILFFPIVLVRLLQKTHIGEHSSWGIYPVIKNNYLNMFLTKLFYFDIILSTFLNFPFGVSLFVVATPIKHANALTNR